MLRSQKISESYILPLIPQLCLLRSTNKY